MSVRLKFALIMLLGIVTAALAYPKEGELLRAVGLKNTNLGVKQGLDLQGGAQLVFQADLSKTKADERNETMDSLLSVIQRRVNATGTSETAVQRIGSDRVSIALPGVTNVNEAINTIGKTANLEFFEVDPTTQETIPTDIAGKDVASATADYDPTKAQPVVRLQLKSGESTKKFGELTTRLSQSGRYLLTNLDGTPTFGPATVQQPITDGVAILSGNLDIKAAKELANQITAGALPVNITLVEQRTVGPTLGRESIQRSIVAGALGLLFVAVFMIVYYRFAGILAVLALLSYTTITLTLYKLTALVPGYGIVLTLAGIAGFILSIGMAVDANILVFERLKEELRSGKTFVAALEAAFDRAWTSIRDSNVSTLITCTILYMTSASTPIIRGFALTLGLGVIVSLFTSIIVSRTLMRMAIRYSWGRRPGFYGIDLKEVKS